MTAIPFDSHEFYSELVQSGLAEKTADALTKAVVKIEKAKIDELATKGDVKELELKIEQVRSEIANSKTELIKWIVGSGFALISVIFAMLRFFEKI
jgi:hypothetical protein